MPYPDTGLGALLLRAGVGRLIHYTSGYLGSAREALSLRDLQPPATRHLRPPAFDPARRPETEAFGRAGSAENGGVVSHVLFLFW